MSANGEPVDGYTAVAWGLADEFVPSATALSVAVQRAQAFLSGEKTVPRKEWDAVAAGQREALDRVFERPDVREILSIAAPGPEEAKEIRVARSAAAKGAFLAMKYGYENGFSAGLANDARAFGEITASPAGQEWVNRFLTKDPMQSSFLELFAAEKD